MARVAKQQLVNPKTRVEGIFGERRARDHDYHGPQNAPAAPPSVILCQPKRCPQAQERQGAIDLHRLECWSKVGQRGHMEGPATENYKPQNRDKECNYL